MKKIMVKIKFEGKNLANCDFWTKSDPYLQISRPPRAGSGFKKVRRTETIRNNLNPKWSLVYISLSELCDGDYELPIQLEVFDEDRNSKDDFIGSVQVTLQQLMKNSQNGTVMTLKKGNKNRGDLYVRECSAEEDHTELMRKMSATSYPERKPSYTGQPFDSQPQPPAQGLYSLPESPHYPLGVPPHESHQAPYHPAPGVHQHESHQAPYYPLGGPPQESHQAPYYPGPGVPQPHPYPYHHPPLTSSASMPAYPQFPSDDPTDTRPASIWI